MAAGFLRELSDGAVDVFSAGSEPAVSVNQVVIAAMGEKGIDISQELPRHWEDETIRAVDVVVVMGCGDECPYFPGTRYVDWELNDPAGLLLEEVRPIRDAIERRVLGLMEELNVDRLGDVG